MSAQAKVAVVDANWIGRTFATDPELKVPRKPRLIPELLVEVMEPDGLLFFGAGEVQVIRGKSARTHLAAMLPLLDGRRTVPELALAYPRLSQEQIGSLVSLLHSRGLLENGVEPEPHDPVHRQVQSWLGRHIDVSRRNVHRGEAWAALARACVHIVGDGARALDLRLVLTGCGIGRVTLANRVSDDDSVPLVLADHDSWAQTPGMRERFVAGRQTPLAVVTPSLLLLGPTLIKGQTACPSCLEKSARSIDRGEPFAAPAALAALAAEHLLAALSRVHGLELHGSCVAFASEEGRLVRHDLAAAPQPGCPDCGAGSAPLDERGRVPWLFHSVTAFPGREQLPPKAHQNHYRIANIELAREQERTALPRAVQLDRALPDGHGVMTLATLSALLLRTAGFHGEGRMARRIAPTGGDLGSPQLYLAATRVDGLAPGIYRYDSGQHALDRVTSEPLPLGVVGAASPACLVFGLGDAAKVMRKYHGFGLRVAHFDSGVALGYLTLIAQTLGLSTWEARHYDPRRLLEALQIPLDRGLLPVFVLGLADGARPTTPAAARPTPAPLVKDHALLDSVLESMMDLLLEPRHGGEQPWHAPEPAPLGALALPSLAALDVVLLKRRATRQFVRGGLTGDDVRQVIAAGMQAVAARTPAGVRSPLLAHVYVTQPLPGLAPGVYVASPSRPELSPIASPAHEATSRRLVIQDALGDAPIAVLLSADLQQVLGERGTGGYADTLVDAGLAVSRSWLTAVALGLVGCPAGGVIADRARLGNRMLLSEAPLIGFFFGRGAAQ